MKYLLPFIFLLTACTSETHLGRCVGAFEDKDPDLIYKAKTSNIVVAVVFSELIVPPIIVVLNEVYCPIDTKKFGKKTNE